MLIVLTKLNDESHRMEIIRDDGTRECADLVSRSFLFHDLLHHATETEAGLGAGFYGLLARGTRLAELNDYHNAPMGAATAPASELGRVEMAVGMLTGAVKGAAEPDDVLAAAENTFSAYGAPVPAWFDRGLIERVREKMRRLQGEWKSVPYRGSMTLSFTVGELRR